MVENNQNKSKRGGRREGAGRKKGSVTKKTREIADKAIEEGITPLEVMIGNMRYAWEKAQRASEGEDVVLGLRKMAQDSAKDAAPYIHPRLANVDANIDMDGKLVIEIVKYADDPATG